MLITTFCTKNPTKTSKCNIKNLFNIINKKIYELYTEKTKKYDEICSHEFLFLESSNYLLKESSDEIIEFLLAKKSKKIHIIVSLINNTEMENGTVYYHSLTISYRYFMIFRFRNNRRPVSNANILNRNYSTNSKPSEKEYYLQKHSSKFIFWHLNIFKRILTKIILKDKQFSFVPIFSDLAFLKATDHDFIFSMLFKQTYKYNNDYFLLINDLKINKHYDLNKKNNKKILEYAFTSAKFELIKNISFERKDRVTQSSKGCLFKNVCNKLVVKEICLCGYKKYLNVNEVYISSLREDKKQDSINKGILNNFGYISSDIDIFTSVTEDKDNTLNASNKSKKPKKNKKILQETCYLTIFYRETSTEYIINFLYNVLNYDLINIYITRSIPGFSCDMPLKEKISFVLVLVKELERFDFKLKYWNNFKSLPI
ncbi:hypothetical protein CWI38_0265p0040 [Hamiltosporidium tvaerminnensis]|uniref:Uncharacterized protein n=1 Tax=Hamiltosporidium tvaerminnensis TaxID=1176355 RepID=A0A4Q9LYW5_9MICR|nr:hypothetical protein CWI38_0265p0040 [Hamiltosporidium tvaerminnensis]